MKVGIYEGQTKVKDMEVASLNGEKSDQVLYQVAVARMSHDREGNASTLTKSEVRGGGKKPWRQKGLGRARSGSTRSPLWRGGGVPFGPKPRDFSKAINKKQKSKALLTVFGKMAELERLWVIPEFSFKSNKTKDFVKFVKPYIQNEKEKIVIIVSEYNEALNLASRNLQKVQVLFLGDLDILPMVFSDKIIITDKAMKELDTRFKKLFQAAE
jgi:large subunit ribosomal protein L4